MKAGPDSRKRRGQPMRQAELLAREEAVFAVAGEARMEGELPPADLAGILLARLQAARPDVLPVRLRSTGWAVFGIQTERVVVLAREDADRIRVRRGAYRLALSVDLTGERGTRTHSCQDKCNEHTREP